MVRVMEQTFKLEDLQTVARRIIQNVPSKIIAFHGDMGVGKTTLIKALLKELGAADSGSSPTFGIVNEYHDRKGLLLAYHFDFYRLEDESEAYDLGFEEYLAQDCWVFIEWTEKVETLLPEQTTPLHLSLSDGECRRLSF